MFDQSRRPILSMGCQGRARRANGEGYLGAEGDGDRYYCRLSKRFRKKRGHMMGGFGSGRPSGTGRDKVESCRSIDVNRLHKKGCLRDGWAGGWQWANEGEKVASINLRAEADRLHLSYRVRIGGGEWEDVAETVGIVSAPCRYGGVRP
ncbi:MAG TPA: hypothetical protein VIF88_07725, partial [Methylocystis sp.]